MADEHAGALERFPPVMLHSILEAARRYEPDLYKHLCRQHHVDADRILGLFSQVEMLGPGQLNSVLADLRQHAMYHEIMQLAGRNALVELVSLHEMKLQVASENQFRTALNNLLPLFAGKAEFTVLQRGNVLFLELWNSIFTRQVRDLRPMCGFYCGMLEELGSGQAAGACSVQEVRCQAVDPDADCCQFQISLL